MHKTVLLALGLLAAAPARAAGIEIDIELPRIEVADYRRPYVAVWVERPDNSVAANLAVWYDLKMRNGEGTQWLKDIRQWWRRAGRDLQVPVDGLTSATRPPGLHRLGFTAGAAPLGELAAGSYRLVVEAVREHGGREVLTLPFDWPPREAAVREASGERELGKVAVHLKP